MRNYLNWPLVLKQSSKEYLRISLDELFLEIEHGDDEHRQWLKDKIEDFKQRKLKNV